MKTLAALLSSISWSDAGLFIGALVVMVLFVRAVAFIARRIEAWFPKKRMLVFGWVPFFSFTIYFVGFFVTIYFIVQPSRELFIGLLASSALALGFVMKDIIASVVAGVVLLMDRPFQVGDRIQFQDFYGDIVSIGLRSVKLLTLDENVVTIPNHRFLSDCVSSGSAGELGMMATVNIHVSPDADLTQSRAILEDIAGNSSLIDHTKPMVVIAQEKLGLGGVVSVILTMKCILKDTRTEKKFQTDFIIETNKAFKKQAIKRV